MIYQLVVFFAIIMIAALLNYPLRTITNYMINYAITSNPDYVTGLPVQFLQAISHWQLVLVALLPALLWFFVNIQKPREPEQ